MFEILSVPIINAKRIRYWDLAATTAQEGKDPDWTVGLRMARTPTGEYIIEHVERFRGAPATVERTIMNTAIADGKATQIGLPQDPGSAGKAYAQTLAKMLTGWNVKIERETGDKATRASPFSAQCEAGNVSVVQGSWNNDYFNELENFPSAKSHDDQVDSSSGAFNMLNEIKTMQVLKIGGL